MSRPIPTTEQPEQITSVRVASTADGAPGWLEIRERVVAALEEDPINEAVLIRHIDRREAVGVDPAQRMLAALTGACLPPADAR